MIMSASQFDAAPSLEPVREDPVVETTLRRATLTLPEAAHVLGISRSTAYELARTGELPALRLGRRLVIPTSALESLLGSVGRRVD